ncbi:hypothetical protein SUNI508_08387 [Seiridium unicorne]|uniref:Uncharacterized protein n=1 Tax=Seiridium unicorne TaxID=138068 RepID=A0ABR2UU55_9PEZI
MVLLDFLNPSVISSAVTCTPACLALSHSGSIIPKQFSNAKARLATPTVGYDSHAKHYNYLFARHETPSSQRWTFVVDSAVSRVEEEVQTLREELGSLENDLRDQSGRSESLGSEFASLAVRVGDIKRLASDDSRLTRLEADIRAANGSMSAAKLEISDSLKKNVKELRGHIQALSTARDETAGSLDKHSQEFREAIAATKQALSATQEDTTRSLEKHSSDFQRELAETKEELSAIRAETVRSFEIFKANLREEIDVSKNALADAQSELKDLRTELDDARKNSEENRQTARAYAKDLSAVQTELAHLRKELSDARNNREEDSKAAQSYAEDLSATKTELQQLKKELNNAKTDSEESKIGARAVTKEVAAFKTEVEDMRRAMARERAEMQSKPVIPAEMLASLTQNISDIVTRLDHVEPIQHEIRFLRSRVQDLELGSGAASSETASTVHVHGSEDGEVPSTPRPEDSRKRKLFMKPSPSMESLPKTPPAKRPALKDHDILNSLLQPDRKLATAGKVKKRVASRSTKKAGTESRPAS